MIWLRLAAVAAVALALYGAYWAVDDRGYQRAKNEAVTAHRDALLAYAERITEGEKQHEKDLLAVADARRAAGGVRVKFPVCTTTAASGDPDGRTGVLPSRVDEAFAEFQRGAQQLIERCEKLNADARRENVVSGAD